MFKKDDIVEVYYPEGHNHFMWTGLRLKIISHTLGRVEGEVMIPHKLRQKGQVMGWGDPSALVLIQSENETQKDDKYFSPFSGKWVEQYD